MSDPREFSYWPTTDPDGKRQLLLAAILDEMKEMNSNLRLMNSYLESISKAIDVIEDRFR